MQVAVQTPGEELPTTECELSTCEMDQNFEAAAVKYDLNMNSEANSMQIFMISLKSLLGFSFLKFGGNVLNVISFLLLL